MKYLNYIEDNLVTIDAGYRGGHIKVNAYELLGVEGFVGAYQNYLGGGLLGAIVGGSDFSPDSLPKSKFKKYQELIESCKKYLHKHTNHEGDDWEDFTYEQNQNMPVSAY